MIIHLIAQKIHVYTKIKELFLQYKYITPF